MAAVLKRHPVLSSMVSYAVLWTASDMVQQKYISKHPKVNLQRTAKTAMIGGLYVAPFFCLWQRYIHRVVPGEHWRAVLKKVVMDQTLFGPWVMSGFFAISHVVHDHNYNPRDIGDELVEKVPKTWLRAVPYWGSVQVVNIMYVPLHFRGHFTAAASFFWAIFLCYMKEKPYHHHHLEHGHLVEDDIVIPSSD